ncbi:MAG: hypothetical protein AB8F78_16070 [Saprospiraceae bacterium]
MSAQSSSKPRVVKDYAKLDPEVLEQIKLEYPGGFRSNLISFKNAKGETVSALPFETEDRYYLVRMTLLQADTIIENDDDYDENGNLKSRAKRAYAAKHDEFDEGDDFNEGEGELSANPEDDFLFGEDDDGYGSDDDEEHEGNVNIDDIDVVDPSSL